MSSERYVVLGLAGARAAWFTEVARWATSGSAPIEFLKCVSVTEARARLSSGRRFSALLLDVGTVGIDRDLVDEAGRRGCTTLAVGRPSLHEDLAELGIATRLPSGFTRAQLQDALAEHAQLVSDAATLADPSLPTEVTNPWRGRILAVTGPAGTGRSTVAMALSQGLADDAHDSSSVVLADLALDADLGVLHDAGEVVPGVSELVEAHRGGRPRPGVVRALTFEVVPRRYRLLLGLRRHRDWAALRPRRVEAAIESLAGCFSYLVADVDADIEGEAEVGSVDVEERNVLARTTLARADLVLVVARPGVTGLHQLVRTAGRLAGHVDPDRLLPVLNRAPRQPRQRAEYQQAFAELAGAVGPGPVPLPIRRGLEAATRDGSRLPSALTRPLANAVHAALDRLGSPAEPREPERVVAGSLGSWDEEAAGS